MSTKSKAAGCQPSTFMQNEIPKELHSQFSSEFKKFSNENTLSGIFYSEDVLYMIKDTVISDNQ